MATKKFDVVAKVGEFEGRDGEKKARWVNCGFILENEGKLSLKMDSIPVGTNGWFNLFPSKENGNDNPNANTKKVAPQGEPVAPKAQKKNELQEETNDLAEDKDNLPF